MSYNKVLYGGDFHGKVAPQFGLGVTPDGKVYYRDAKGNWQLFIPSILPTIDLSAYATALSLTNGLATKQGTFSGITTSIVLTEGTLTVVNGVITAYTATP